MLKIDDIPGEYYNKKAAIYGHTIQFWSKPQKTILFKNKIQSKIVMLNIIPTKKSICRVTTNCTFLFIVIKSKNHNNKREIIKC